MKYVASQRNPRKRRASLVRDEERRNLRNLEPRKNGDGNEEDEPITKTINVIIGGFAGGGPTKSTHKKHL